jgi:hypothetical protein
MADGGLPGPPADLSARNLPIYQLPAGSRLFRIHKSADGARYFGRSAKWRFDDPTSSYGTLYAGLLPRVAFAEVFLGGPGAFVALSELADRSLCSFTALRAVRLVALHGRHLAVLGANALVTSGPYALSQRWSRALHDHPGRPDGIAYRAAHDNDEFAAVVFERASAAIDEGSSTALLGDLVLLGEILDHYQAAIR